ncbi:MAG: carboxypeptidase-like regulatory domain-containing protein, partial [Candidatus Micrarchaeota archaeon]
MQKELDKPGGYVDERQGGAERVSLDVPCGNNAIKYPKPDYTTHVEDQEEITAMSYQEYYALHKDKIDQITGDNKSEKLSILAAFHKAGKRAEKALNTRGANWRESDALRDDDKHYIEVFEKNLALLESKGISLKGDAEQVLSTIKETFGKTGEEIVTKSRRMPIFDRVILKEEELECGDRLLDKRYENNSIRGLRGGDARDTAILHLLTTMTGQGVSDTGSQFENFDVFTKATVEAGRAAFSESDDTLGLKKRNVPDGEIEKEKQEGNFAIGSHMFTQRRHEETPTYYLLAEQLDCVISLSSDCLEFTRGKAPKKFSVDGVLSITQQQSEIERGINKMVHITLQNEAGEELHTATPITNRDGNFSYVIPKNVLNSLGPGNYTITARFKGQIRAEELDCPNEVPLKVNEPPPRPPPIMAPKKEPLQVYATRYSPRRSMDSETNTYEEKREILRSDKLKDIEDLWAYDEGGFPSLGKVQCPPKKDLIRMIKNYTAKQEVQTQDFKFGVRGIHLEGIGNGLGVHGIVHVTAMEKHRRIDMEVIRHQIKDDGTVDYETITEQDKKTVRYPKEEESKTSVGLEVGKEA